MKLHLPVRLFRAVMALFPLVVSTISQPLYAEAPDDAVEVILIDEDDLRADIPTPLLGNDVEFWYSSDSPELSILSEATSSVFVAAEEPCLAFEELGYSENSVAVTDISGDVSTLTLSSNGSVTTETSRAYEVDDGGTLALNGKGSLMFSNHVLSYGAGGAIYGGRDITITMSDNESVSFIGNSSGGSGNGGGAIYAITSTITLSDNKSVLFSGNSSRSYGGAICGGKGKQGTCALTLSGNRSVTFRENSASTGGAINTGTYSTITLNDNESVLFSGNSASGDGGAINAENNSTIILSNNKSVTFSGNSAGNCGGAIVGFYSNTIQLNYNENVTFSENSSGTGGAIYFQGSAELIGNETVTFSGNSAGSGLGGAIDGSFFSSSLSRITLSDNGSVTFSGNSASSGGAIWYVGSLNIRNNDYVLFEKNVEKSDSNYRLNSICTLDGYASISLSAAEGASIEFRDSVYMGSGNIMNLNGEYGGIKQTGDIIFTGKYTETHLNEILKADGVGRLATAEEIRLSRTTEVYATTYLYGGRLRVEDGAVYKGNGIIAESGSAATVLVKDAVLSHDGYELTFHSGTTLELTGNNSISGNINMHNGSSLRLNAETSLGLTDVIGDLYLGGGMTLALSNDAEWRCENGVLLYVSGDLTGWDADTLTVTGAGTYNSSDVSWVGNLLVLNYNAETFNRYFNGVASKPGNLMDSCAYHHFSEISFTDYTDAGNDADKRMISLTDNGRVTFSENSTTSRGGAIYVGSDSMIMLNNNENVTFSGNSTANYGGAIYVGADSLITLSGNGRVSFSCNTSDYGGSAIDVDCRSTLMFSDNGSVIFRGNTTTYSYGGAILASGSTVKMLSNGSVEFCENSGLFGGSAIYGGTITLSGNGNVSFSCNTSVSGSAIYGETTITLSNNEIVTFNGNSSGRSGGAIYGYAGSTITLSDNGSVEFRENTASLGGAIYVGSDSMIMLNNNENVTFSGNSASSSYAYGGAIDGDTITLSDNESVTFSGNTASSSYAAFGGAIYGYGNLSIRNNDSVLFEKNAEERNGTYRLRSIYAGGSGDVVSLSAAAGKSIEFRDSIYIGTGSTVELNADYTDAEGVTHKQTGDILFTGATTEADLLEVKGSAGTAEEILNSRTTEVYAMTILDGGRLRVEDGAVYKGYGITVAAGSGATLRVKDAELSHAGYDITLASGTTLEAEGVNAVAASRLVMQEGSTLSFVLNEDNLSAAALTLDGVLSLNGSVSLVLNGGLASGRYSLMTYTGLSGDTAQLRAELPEEYELVWDDSSTDVIVWRQVTLPEEAAEWTENHTYTRAVADTDVIYDSVSLNGGIYEVSGSGSLGVGGILSVTGGADVMVDVDTMTLGVEVGDDSRLDLRKSLNLVSVMRLSGDETEYTEAISVGRNAVLLLTDASLLGQVAVADESSELYYQTTAGDKLLKFTGDMGDGGLNLTTDESGTKVYAADSAGFAGNITVLSGATLVNAASSANDGVPFGENYAANANRSITVQKDAELDINGRETYYRVVLEEGAVLTNGGADVHESWKGLPVIDLTGDAEVNAAAQICMVGGSYATNYLNLNGHKLSKTGADCLILRKTDISAGTLAVNEGLLYFMGSTSFASGTSVEVNNGGTLWIPETTGSYAGKLTVNAGGRVYLGEGPNGTLDGDLGTDNRSIDLSTLSEVALSGGTLTFRGGSLALGEVAVTADSTLEIWDQDGSSGIVSTASTIETLDAGAALNLATTWKSHLNINVLKGAGSLTVGSSREQHRVEVQDMRAYTGSFAVNGSQSTLALNLAKEYVLSAGRVTKDADSTLLLHGEGAYDIGTEKALAAGVTLAEDWTGSVRLTGATLSGDTLAGLSNAASTVELHGVSGYLSRADAQGGTQTYTANLKLTDNGDTAAWDLNNGYKGDVRVFSGEISGTGTLKRSSYKGTNQTLIFTGDAGGWTGAIDHAPNSGKNSGAVVSTNVTFSGTKELNVEMRTNGKGELNVTLDDEHLTAGSKVKVNGSIGADSLTVTEGTVAQLQNEAAVTRLAVAGSAELGTAGSVQHGEGTQLVSREEADLALLFGVESTETQIIGLHAESALQNISITAGSAYLMQNLALDNVSFSAADAALTLRGVTFSGDCSFSVGESGSILLDAATLTVVLPELAGHEDGVLRLDYSNLFHCVASGQLDIALDTDSLMEEGYHSITFDFGDDVDYSRLSLKLEGASYSGSSAGVAHFSLSVPEPTSTALSLLALAGLAARRRRK